MFKLSTKLITYKYLECLTRKFMINSFIHEKIKAEAQWNEFIFMNCKSLIRDPEEALRTSYKLRRLASRPITPKAHRSVMEYTAERIAYLHHHAVIHNE